MIELNRFPHWAAILAEGPEFTARYTTLWLEVWAHEYAPEFAAYVYLRDRWLDELGRERRTYRPELVAVGPFVSLDIRHVPTFDAARVL